MRQHLVLTATGTDRPKRVARVTRLIVEHGGNDELNVEIAVEPAGA